MKERIYSIPITDALNENCDCVMCSLEKKLEDEAVEYFLGPSMMEVDGRTLTNSLGFCRRHMGALYESGNRLSLALILDTHIEEVRKRVQRNSKSPKSSMFGKNTAKKYIDKMIKEVDDITSSCALCDKLDKQMQHCAENFVYLWETEKDFRDKFENSSNGLCLPHMSLILKAAFKSMGGKRLDEFVNELYRIQNDNLMILNDDVHWFTQKYDYRNQDAPWGNAKDALPRAVHKLGKF